jgi:hypothetical protein
VNSWVTVDPAHGFTANLHGSAGNRPLANARYLVVEFSEDITGTIGAEIAWNNDWYPGAQVEITLIGQRAYAIDLNDIPLDRTAVANHTGGYRIRFFRPYGTTVARAFLSNGRTLLGGHTQVNFTQITPNGSPTETTSQLNIHSARLSPA